MIQKIKRLLQRKNTAPAVIEDKEVVIPVGGIDPSTGAIYEKKVYPDGTAPIYKEVAIDTQTESTEETVQEKRGS